MGASSWPASAFFAAFIGAGCGGNDDDGDGDGDVSLSELRSHLPAADELGLRLQRETDWDNATDLLGPGSRYSGCHEAKRVGGAIEDAGFQPAVGTRTRGFGPHPRADHAAQFDSEEGALEAREALHEEDIKAAVP